MDWNNDGKKDLLSGDCHGRIWLFVNTGTDASPAFTSSSYLYVNGSVYDSGSDSMPEVVDWNNDGRKDLLVGLSNGKVQLLLNTGTDSAPAFSSAANLQMGAADLHVSGGGNGYASPLAIDWNGDGKKDLLSGRYDGQVSYFENVGTDEAPVFTSLQTLEGSGGLLDVGTYSRITPSDWDNDGQIDLVFGSGTGSVFYARAVEPDDLQVSPAQPLLFVGQDGGPFSPGSHELTLSNAGSSPINWTASKAASWLDLSITGGVLAPGARETITVSLNAGAGQLAPSVYTAQIEIINSASGKSRVRLASLQIRASGDFFTQTFRGNTHDMVNRRLILLPDGSPSSYRPCLEIAAEFSTDPTGGVPLNLGDDGQVGVRLAGGKKVAIYDRRDSLITVCSNGFVGIGARDTSNSGSLDDHFRYPRISGLFSNLDPSSGGTISWKQTEDRIAITFDEVPQISRPYLNTFQIEMFYNGRIQITWLRIEVSLGLIGISEGNGTPAGFEESDLSEYPAFGGEPVGVNINLPPGYEVDTLELGRLLYGDRDYAFESPIPGDLLGQTYIRTLNADKDSMGWDFLILEADQPVRVIVAHDARFGSRPGWLRFWNRKEGILLTSDLNGPERFLYSRDYPAGRIHLGGNRDAGMETNLSMYSVVVLPRDPDPSRAADGWSLYP